MRNNVTKNYIIVNIIMGKNITKHQYKLKREKRFITNIKLYLKYNKDLFLNIEYNEHMRKFL